MFRRMMLAISLVATLGVAGFGMANSAEARGCHRGGHGGYGGGYGGYYSNYGGYYPHVHRASYYPPVYYGQPAYYGGYGGGHCHRDSGLYISLGF